MSGDLPSAEVFFDAPGLAPKKGAIQEVSDACDRFLAERAGRPYGGLAQQITEQCKANTAKGIAEGKYEDHSDKKTSHRATEVHGEEEKEEKEEVAK